MFTTVQRVKNFKYRNHTLDQIYLITDQNGRPVILALLYAIYLSRFGVTYQSKELTDDSQSRLRCLTMEDVSDTTIRSYIYCLAKFLNYIEECKGSKGTPSMHYSSACSESFVNEYLNAALPKTLNSANSLHVHMSALNAYYNWLDYFEISPRLNLRVFRKTRQYVAALSGTQYYIQYVSRSSRFRLLNCCETLGEKLIMRMGYEVGLRTSEVAGLRVEGAKKLRHLFGKLEDPKFDSLEIFSYLLEGKYTKGGASRSIFFDRELLQDMKRYFDSERKWLLHNSKKSCDEFFLKRNPKDKGSAIGTEHASRVFRKRATQAGLNPQLSFHDLRHTFATQLYHMELSRSGNDTHLGSGPLLTVAQRLGHRPHNGQAPSTTTRYIRMRLQMIELEESTSNGDA